MENMEHSFNSCNSNEPKQFVPHHGEFVNERMINIKFGGISRTAIDASVEICLWILSRSLPTEFYSEYWG